MEIVVTGLEEYLVEVALSFTMALVEYATKNPLNVQDVYMKPCEWAKYMSFNAYCLGNVTGERTDNVTMTTYTYRNKTLWSYETPDIITMKVRTLILIFTSKNGSSPT